ncbi:hypothetical protein G7K71_02985 [Desulfofundulus sp. TPOSR]|uniref:hypothetical protein n=1 Tax=Desulfofundulus sp. TPOSR TaxID=2714340 RepID=UPI001408C7F0|nr:hypothetical protein [Desulfofundulus sp. TPOSR]NHM25992.1 hypothetical protein [Desulfofundulus sp. TPOSR]
MDTWLSWEPELTPAAAEEDAAKFYRAMSDVMHEIVLCRLVFMADLSCEDCEKLADRKTFLQPFLTKLGVKTDARGLLVDIFKDFYHYVTSELDTTPPLFRYRKLLKSWTMLLQTLFHAFFISRHNAELFSYCLDLNISVSSKSTLSAAVSPRFVAALRMLSIRETIIIDLRKQLGYEQLNNIDENEIFFRPEHGLSTPDLAFLSGVSYQYVWKLYKAGKLPGTKSKLDGNIYIKSETAVAFAITRLLVPNWVRTLAKRAKIDSLLV